MSALNMPFGHIPIIRCLRGILQQFNALGWISVVKEEPLFIKVRRPDSAPSKQ